jgi:hypothetical protein
MTQKIISGDKSISDLLQTIEPKEIADESMRHTVEVLLKLSDRTPHILNKRSYPSLARHRHRY